MKNILRHKTIIIWIPFFTVITLLSGLLYVAIQQDLRLSANDPQIQIAQDSANSLSAGINPLDLIPSQKIDISRSLATFMIIYNNKYQVIASSATLNGSTPKIPNGVLSYTKSNNEDRFTWQPVGSVRIAAVSQRYDGDGGGYVLVGRSMKEIENRIDNISHDIFFGWFITSICTLLSIYMVSKFTDNKKDSKR